MVFPMLYREQCIIVYINCIIRISLFFNALGHSNAYPLGFLSDFVRTNIELPHTKNTSNKCILPGWFLEGTPGSSLSSKWYDYLPNEVTPGLGDSKHLYLHNLDLNRHNLILENKTIIRIAPYCL